MIPTIEITKAIQAKYKKGNASFCPFCGSEFICLHDSNASGLHFERTLVCDSCQACWTEEYEYKRITTAYQISFTPHPKDHTDITH